MPLLMSRCVFVHAWCRGWRRQVFVVMLVMMVIFLHHLLLQRGHESFVVSVVQPFSLLRMRADVNEVSGERETLVTTRRTTTLSERKTLVTTQRTTTLGERKTLVTTRRATTLGERKTLATTRRTTITPPRPSTVDKGNKTKSHAPKDASLKKDKHERDPFKNMVILSSWPPKVKFPLMAFTNLGRLGNRLNSYATALTFHAAHHTTATVAVTLDSMHQLVSLLDPANLTLPVMDRKLLAEARKKQTFVGVGPDYGKNDMVSHLEPTFRKAEKAYRESGKPKVYALDGYPNRMWMLAGHHHTIRAAFRFREDLKEKVAKFLEKVRQEKGRRNITFVGFHIRRTDYRHFIKSFFRCDLPGPAFYDSALKHYRATLQNPVFVVASDNLTYAREHLSNNKDVVFSEMKTPAEDMALLGSCSHSIMTVGSFGFWASFFTGGQVVYPLLNNCTLKPFVHPDNLGSRGYENWKKFDINGGGPV